MVLSWEKQLARSSLPANEAVVFSGWASTAVINPAAAAAEPAAAAAEPEPAVAAATDPRAATLAAGFVAAGMGAEGIAQSPAECGDHSWPAHNELIAP